LRESHLKVSQSPLQCTSDRSSYFANCPPDILEFFVAAELLCKVIHLGTDRSEPVVEAGEGLLVCQFDFFAHQFSIVNEIFEHFLHGIDAVAALFEHGKDGFYRPIVALDPPSVEPHPFLDLTDTSLNVGHPVTRRTQGDLLYERISDRDNLRKKFLIEGNLPTEEGTT